jgi:hypothetical protein
VNETITTTANRVKAGGYWCEDATAITQAALDRHGLDWDTEIPVSWGFENLGLANTILSLGAVRPRFQPRADAIVVRLMRHLYNVAVSLGTKAGFTITATGHWLGNPDRASSCDSQHEMWKQLAKDITNPAEKAVADSMALLFSAERQHIICVHASKLLLFATMQSCGEEAARETRTNIIEFLQKELEA